MILNRYNFTNYDPINFATCITLYNTYYFSIYLGLYYISLRGYEKMVWDRTASIFNDKIYETGLHSFFWQDCLRQDCIHFYDKMAWDRTASIFMVRLYETGLHSFLWQDGMRQDCIHFEWQAGKRPVLIHFFMTSHHNTGTHPFWWQASIIPVLIHFYDKPA